MVITHQPSLVFEVAAVVHDSRRPRVGEIISGKAPTEAAYSLLCRSLGAILLVRHPFPLATINVGPCLSRYRGKPGELGPPMRPSVRHVF
jgi:hypothetical protein